MAARADLALVGIGALGLQSALYQLNILKEDDCRRMRAKGAVGEIGLRFYNDRGEAVEDEINHRVVGLELAHYRAIPRVIAVAGGEDKVPAIRAALRGKIINVLVTDQKTALSLLEQTG